MNIIFAKLKLNILQIVIGASHITYVPWQRMAIYATALDGDKNLSDKIAKRSVNDF